MNVQARARLTFVRRARHSVRAGVGLSAPVRNRIASVFGGKLYTQPSWLPVMEFPWWICFGTIVTFSVAILFRSGREHHPPIETLAL